ncbi:MAG: hypothetical protein JNN01_20855 [Opitutaceae bacterium]|nr:hypothetical protein [Opitutaceae bacterium]
MKTILVSFLLTCVVVAALSAAPELRLQHVGVVRFGVDASGRDVSQRGWLDFQGRFELDVAEPVLSTVVVPPAARNRFLVTREMAGAYRRLGPVAMANFVVDDAGEFFLLGAREYIPIAVSPAAQAGAGRVPNLSTRGRVGPGFALIGGFVVLDQPRTVLIRVVGPGLAAFEVVSPAPDPGLTLFRGDEVHLSNDNWGTGSTVGEMEYAQNQVGAFPLAIGSKDAACLVTLPVGAYTVQATSAVAGEVLMEVYLLP